MDVRLYKTLKEKGLIKIVKVGNSCAYELTKFDPSTGEVSTPEVGALSKEQIQAQRAELQAQITALDELLADLPI